jgi:hypothetical protein
MSSSYRLKERQATNAYEFGSDYASHYLAPWGNCMVGDTAVPIGRSDGVKVCVKTRTEWVPDSVVENSAKGNTINGLYKSYNLYYPPQEFQTRTIHGNPWPEGGMDRQENILKDYIKLPIRYNAYGFENMQIESGQETPYGWAITNQPPSIPIQELPWSIPSNTNPTWHADFDVYRLHSTQRRGDLRNELYTKYPHPFRDDYWHTKQVKGTYPEYQQPTKFLPGSKISLV